MNLRCGGGDNVLQIGLAKSQVLQNRKSCKIASLAKSQVLQNPKSCKIAAESCSAINMNVMHLPGNLE